MRSDTNANRTEVLSNATEIREAIERLAKHNTKNAGTNLRCLAAHFTMHD